MRGRSNCSRDESLQTLMQSFCVLMCLFGPMVAAQKVNAAACEFLTHLKLPRSSIDSATTVAAGGLSLAPEAYSGAGSAAPPALGSLPAFCRVSGTSKPTSDSNIGFEV